MSTCTYTAYKRSRSLSANKVSTQTTQDPLEADPLVSSSGWSADLWSDSEVRVEVVTVFPAAEAALTGKEESVIGQAPTLTPQGLSGSRTISSLAPLHINECSTVHLNMYAFVSKQMKGITTR